MEQWKFCNLESQKFGTKLEILGKNWKFEKNWKLGKNLEILHIWKNIFVEIFKSYSIFGKICFGNLGENWKIFGNLEKNLKFGENSEIMKKNGYLENNQ